MINAQTALDHQLLQIAICEAISQVPPDAQDDDLIFEMASSEQRGSRLFHQAHGIRYGPGAFATDPPELSCIGSIGRRLIESALELM
jgi:hypothetical protein